MTPIGPRAGLKPGAEVLSTDVCVPISALAACVTATRQDIDRLGLLAPIVGHVGDGNFHVMPLIDPADPEERRKVQAFLDRLVERALAYGGTCTGEHGVGQGKINYLAAEHGARHFGHDCHKKGARSVEYPQSWQDFCVTITARRRGAGVLGA